MIILRTIVLLLLLGQAASGEPVRVTVGSKKFTESVILGEMLSQLAGSTGAESSHRAQLGGSRILFNALQRGDLDAYPEYTGTLELELLAGRSLGSDGATARILGEMGLRVSAPIGFNNTYAIGVRRETSERLAIRRISDLRNHPGIAIAFTNEFMDREDGWPGLRDAYDLPQQNVRGIDHDLAYRALESGDIIATDLYSTDGEIAYYGLVVLEDDLGFFPRYDGVILYRADLAERAPDALKAMLRLQGAIDERSMVAMNELAKIGVADAAGSRRRVPEQVVAQQFIEENLAVTTDVRVPSRLERLTSTTGRHLLLVVTSMMIAIIVAIPLGIVSARLRVTAPAILGATGILQTIPALAMLALLIGPFGLTPLAAIVGLLLYSLLPIVRNTHAGLTGIAGDVLESADAIGLSGTERLVYIELPIALPVILAGIKTAAVINIGTATLGALIGAGGYGDPILTGIRLDDIGLILEGTIPAATMAVAAQILFDLMERSLVSRGLRL